MKRIFAALLALLLLLSLCGCASSDYRKAERLEAAGDHAGAAAAFEALGDYEDSAERALACRYGEAEAVLAAGDHEKAAALFAALGDYRDSAARSKEAAGAVHGNTLSGDWYYTQDSTENILSVIQANMAQWEGLWEYCDYGPCTMIYRLTLFEDGSFTFCLDRDSLSELADELIGRTKTALRAYLEDFVTQTYQSQGLSLEQVYHDLNVEDMDGLLRWLNYDVDRISERIVSRKSFDTAANRAVVTGTYVLSANTLELTVSGGTDIEIFSPGEDRFTVTGRSEDSTTDVLRLSGNYPAVFSRQP